MDELQGRNEEGKRTVLSVRTWGDASGDGVQGRFEARTETYYTYVEGVLENLTQ